MLECLEKNLKLQKSFDNYRSIMASKSKCIAQCNIYLSFLCFIKCKIEFWVKFRIIRVVIDRRRNEPIINRSNTSDRLYRTSTTKQMSSHRFGTTDI